MSNYCIVFKKLSPVADLELFLLIYLFIKKTSHLKLFQNFASIFSHINWDAKKLASTYCMFIKTCS